MKVLGTVNKNYVMELNSYGKGDSLRSNIAVLLKTPAYALRFSKAVHHHSEYDTDFSILMMYELEIDDVSIKYQEDPTSGNVSVYITLPSKIKDLPSLTIIYRYLMNWLDSNGENKFKTIYAHKYDDRFIPHDHVVVDIETASNHSTTLTGDMANYYNEMYLDSIDVDYDDDLPF